MKKITDYLQRKTYAPLLLIPFALVYFSVLGLIIHISEYKDSIKNPVNAEYVIQTALDYEIDPDEVTQEMFNQRYKNK